MKRASCIRRLYDNFEIAGKKVTSLRHSIPAYILHFTLLQRPLHTASLWSCIGQQVDLSLMNTLVIN